MTQYSAVKISNVTVNTSLVMTGRSERMRKISPLQGLDPRTIHTAANRYTDWAIPAHRRSWIHSENHFSATFAEKPVSEVRFPGRLLYEATPSLPRKQTTFSPLTILLPVLSTKLSVGTPLRSQKLSLSKYWSKPTVQIWQKPAFLSLLLVKPTLGPGK